MLKITKILLITCLVVLNTYPVDVVLANNDQQHAKSTQTSTYPLTDTHDKAGSNTSKSEIRAHHDEPRELSMFFKIGIGLNIAMLIIYVTWAVRQWRQSDRSK
ncbi:MAG: hypothetical protein OEZ38_08330 [Gammaproteobacteria bacterium]|nr:hypothetical protein [Gammaproteobacteria bacterium]